MLREIPIAMRVKSWAQLRSLAKDIMLFTAFTCLARATLTEGLSPFSAAITAAAWACGLPVCAYAGMFIGLVSRGMWFSLIASALTLGLCWALSTLAGGVYKRQASISLAGGQTFALTIGVVQGALDPLIGLFTVIAAMLLMQVYVIAIKVMQSLRSRKLLGEEEVIALCILVGTGLMGVNDIQYNGVSLACMLAGTVTLLLAYTGGAGAGAASGVALGIMMSASGQSEYIALLGLMGTTGGALKKLGKVGTVIGALLTGAIFAFYSKLDYGPFFNGASASFLFLLLPNIVFDEVGRFVNASLMRERNRREYLHRLRNITALRLKEYSEVFREMGDIFCKDKCEEKMREWELSCIQPFCKSCPAQYRCWEDPNRLQRELTSIALGNAPPFRLERCRQMNDITACAKALIYAAERENVLTSQTERSRHLAGKQMLGVCATIEQLSKKLEKEVNYDDMLEARLFKVLDKNGLSAKDVIAQNAGGRLSITIEGRGCTNKCADIQRKIVSSECGKNMRLAYKQCDSICRATYEQARAFEADSAIVQAAKNEVIGDSVYAGGLPDGRYLMVISDGMGTGERAAQESGAALSLLKKLYNAGVERESAIETINRLLMLRKQDEMFTTMDLCCMDLMTGQAQLIKLGAAPSYWINSEGVIMLNSDSLPVGIVDVAKSQVMEINMSIGDHIILMSDGVYDVLCDDLEPLIGSCIGNDPKVLAQCLIQAALDRGANDDMTVLVSYIKEP